MKKIRFTGFLKLIIALVFITKVCGCKTLGEDGGENDKKPNVIKGSDKILKSTCSTADSCKIEYENYTVTTKPHKESSGQDIVVMNNKSKKSLNIKVDPQYDEQYFNGLYKDLVFIDFGTSVFRTFYIYDIKKEKVINSFGYFDGVIFNNEKLTYKDKMSEERQKKLKLKNKTTNPERFSEGNGYWEEFNYDFKTNKIEPTGKYEWQD